MKNRLLTAVLVMALMVTGLAMPVAAYGAEENGSETAAAAEEAADLMAGSQQVQLIDIEIATTAEVEESYAYTGEEVKPEPVVTIETENSEAIVLEEGTDYTVNYADGEGNEVDAPLMAGDYQVVIEGTGDYTGTETIPYEIYMPEGWNSVEGEWFYYTSADVKLTNGWAKDGGKWRWLGSDGEIVKNEWVKDNGKWYYLKSDGYMAASEWIKDGGKWYWLKANGAMAASEWIKNGGSWYFLKANGAMAANEWAKDSAGWMWMAASGKITSSKWIKDHGEWYFLKSNGYMADNEWAKDSCGWMWMDGSGRITTSKWIKSGSYWYYLKDNGYMAANEWVKDSSGLYMLDKSGHIRDLKRGCPYVWGASGPTSFDCSGYTMYMMAQRGIYLPHNAAGQYYALSSKNIGTDWHKAQPGDLVFYSYGGPGSSHHVGIYAGDGKLLHASSSHHAVVITSVTYTNGHIAAICRP